MRVRDALAKEENLLSEEEICFNQKCCHIMKSSDNDKVNHGATMTMSKGEGDPTLTIAAIQKLLEDLGNEAEVCRSISGSLPDHLQLGEPGGSCVQL